MTRAGRVAYLFPDMISALYDMRVELQTFWYFAIFAVALRWGAGPEKYAAASLFFLRVIEWPYHFVFPDPMTFGAIDWGHAIIDMIVAAALIAIAVRANRMYVMWLAAVQLLSVFAHLTRDLAAAATPKGYALLSFTPSYMELAIMTGGLIYHVRREKRYGSYRQWRDDAPDPYVRPDLFEPRKPGRWWG